MLDFREILPSALHYLKMNKKKQDFPWNTKYVSSIVSYAKGASLLYSKWFTGKKI